MCTHTFDFVVFAIATSKKDKMSNAEKNALVKRVFDSSGTLVVADTKAQLDNKAIMGIKHYQKVNPGGKFMVVVDECDAMFRTEDRSQVFEQALVDLLALNPTMVRY